MKRKLLFTAIAIIVFATATMAQLPSYVPSNGLVGFWPFTGNANDVSGNGNNGTVNGATLSIDRFGNVNNAYSFNGTNNYISVSNSPFTNVPFTISAWVKLNSQVQSHIIGLGESGATNHKLYFTSSYMNTGKPGIGISGTCDITSTSNIVQNNVWTHLVVCVSSYSVSGVTFYINGIAYTNNTTAGAVFPFPLNNTGFTIGKHTGSTNNPEFLNGNLDDIGVWNRALTQQEITALYQGSNNINVPAYVPSNGLAGWWPFTGNANDESGNNFNAAVISATLTTDRFGNINSAYHFNNVTGGLKVNNFMLIDSNYTVSFWVNTNVPIGNEARLISNDWTNCGEFVIYQNIPGTFGFGTNQTCFSNVEINNNTLQLNIWYNITAIRNANIVYLYVNGTLASSNLNNTINGNIANKLFFGGDPFQPGSFFLGKLDDIGIWNRVLSQAEITALYNGCNLSVSNPSNQNVNLGSNAQFITSTSNLSATYQWQTDLGLGFQNISNAGQYNGANNDTLIVSNTQLSNNNQQFRCIVNDGGCKDTSTVATLTIANIGIYESKQNQFKVYPNPATNQINVQINQNLIGSSYLITDQIGKIVLSGKLNAEKSTIEIGDLSGGIYLFSLGNNAKQTFKVIKK